MAFCLAACSDAPDRSARFAGRGGWEASVLGGEDEASITVHVEARGRRGSVYLKEVFLDNTMLLPDSSVAAGMYYEAHMPASAFDGAHALRIAPDTGAAQKVPFTFKRFTLQYLKVPLTRSGIELAVTGLPDGARIRVSLVDTSYMSDDLNQDLQLQQGRLRIPAVLLQKLSPGPVLLELTSLQELQTNTKGFPGRLRVEYVLRRELELR